MQNISRDQFTAQDEELPPSWLAGSLQFAVFFPHCSIEN